jgi:lysophospholipase L1-like esterase
MKWVYGALIIGVIPVLSSLLSKQEQAILEEINSFKNATPFLKSKVQAALNQPFSFFHLGDSHVQIGGISKGIINYLTTYQKPIQADLHFPTDIFQELYNADYIISTSGGNWQGTTLTNETNKEIIGMHGRNFSFVGKEGKISFTTKNKTQTIQTIAILHQDKELEFQYKHAQTTIIQLHEKLYKTTFIFEKPRKKAIIKLKPSSEKLVISYGILINQDQAQNTYYNAGVSGVKYLDFFKTKEFFKQLEWVQPTFLCLTLGTNDSYAPIIDTNTFENDLNLFITKIKKASPNTILFGMTTPDTYYMNQAPKQLLFINKTIRSVFSKQEVLLWDWYEIMGGQGSIKVWDQLGLVSPDLLHFNQKGYELIGKSFANALLSLQNE